MHGHELLHKLLLKSLPCIHKKRLLSVVNATHSLLLGKELSLTQLGRHMPGKAKERHNVRKMDRLLGNKKLHEELKLFYQGKAHFMLANIPEVCISVDWSATDKRKDWHILRASISLRGRAESIYEEIHPDCLLNSNSVHKSFLQSLKAILPKHIKAIIVTDAGFCNPWFKEVERLGYDWVGRTKSSIQYTLANTDKWGKCSNLYDQATSKASFVGDCLLAKTNKLRCHIVTYKEKIKGRICKNRSGKKSRRTSSQRIAIRQRTPWVLVTSLGEDKATASRIVQLYKRRMQIEENFRDTKSLRYGFSLRLSLSRNAKRIEVLLLFAMLASFTCWLLSLVACAKRLHYDFQANTVKNRTVLSMVYLGCQLVRRKIPITMKEAIFALKQLEKLAWESAICNF